MRRSPTILVSIALAACSQAGGFQQEFVEACESSSSLGRPVCACMAEKAEEDLNEDERTFVLAVLRGDDARTDEMRDRLGLEGAMRAGMFMTNVASCAVAGDAP